MGERLAPERLFLSLAVVFGLLLVFIVPPIQVADEDSHFKKAYAVSTGALYPSLGEHGGADLGDVLPVAVLEFVNDQRYMMGDPSKKYRYSDLYLRSALPVDLHAKRFETYSAASGSALVYAPPALAIALGRALYALVGERSLFTPAAALYCGRLGNLAFFVAAVFIAIRMVPCAKLSWCAAALLPMTLSLAAGLNRDGVVIGAAFLFTALVFRHRTQGQFGVKDAILAAALACVLLLGKQIYFLLGALLLLVPRDRWPEGRRWRWIAGILVVPVAAFALDLALLPRGPARVPSASSSAVHAQVQFVLAHPYRTLELLLVTPVRDRLGWAIGTIGNLGWLDTNFPYPFLGLAGAFVLCGALFDEASDEGLSRGAKLLGCAVILATLFALEIAFYVLWTPLPGEAGVGADHITGIQGRYLLPLLPLALLIARNRVTVRWSTARELIAVLIGPALAAIQMFTVFIVVVRYWIP